MGRETGVCAIALTAAMIAGGNVEAATVCGATNAGSYGGVATSSVGNARMFKTSELRVDADGAPNSYRVDGQGLSFTCDGVVAVVDGVRRNDRYDKKHKIPKKSPESWQALCRAAWKRAQSTKDYSHLAIFGFEKDETGKPRVQKEGDPLPNEAFITTTAVAIPGTPEGTQRRYVDATKIPYVVLPSDFVSAGSIQPGDVAVVYWPAKNAHAFAAYGDGGGLGEASVRLHADLGNDPIITVDGVKRAMSGINTPVLTVVFPGKTSHPILDAEKWRAEIATMGEAALTAWGGNERLKACAQ